MSMETKPSAEQSARAQQSYSFILLLDGIDRIDQATADALFEAGCNDALFGMSNGNVYLEFDREAASALDAMMSAVAAVEGCVPGLRVREVVPPGEQALALMNAYLRLRNEAKDPSAIDIATLRRALGK